LRIQPRYLANAPSSAVTPISPATKKFHLFIRRNTLDNSPWSISSAPGFMVGKRHIADMNQNIAEPHAVIIAAVTMNDVIITLMVGAPKTGRHGPVLPLHNEVLACGSR
jgi:hypothetical protein